MKKTVFKITNNNSEASNIQILDGQMCLVYGPNHLKTKLG